MLVLDIPDALVERVGAQLGQTAADIAARSAESARRADIGSLRRIRPWPYGSTIGRLAAPPAGR